MLTFGFDEFYPDGKDPKPNVWKVDFKNNIPAFTQGKHGYKWGDKPKDSDLFKMEHGGKPINLPVKDSSINYYEYVDYKKALIYDIDPSISYYYPLYIIECNFWKDKDTARYPHFNPKIATDLIEGRAKILMFYLLEAMDLDWQSINILNSWVANYHLPNDSIVIISCSHDYGDFVSRDHGIKHITFNYWENVFFEYFKKYHYGVQEKLLNRKGKRKKKFLCYNRRHKNHRTFIISGLKDKGLLNDGFVSYGPPINDGESNQIICLTGDHELLKMLPMTFDNRDLEYNFARDFVVNDYMETYFHIVTESWHKDNKNTFFSEKIFKPIAGMQPFFLVSTPESLNQLRKNGYKTFSKWWDESYDLSYDLRERTSMIIDQVEKLCLLSHDDLQSMLDDMRPTLIHNFKTFEKRCRKLVPNLHNELEEILWK
jgi:hypothetical protein